MERDTMQVNISSSSTPKNSFNLQKALRKTTMFKTDATHRRAKPWSFFNSEISGSHDEE